MKQISIFAISLWVLLVFTISPASAAQEQIIVCDQTQTSGQCDLKAQNFANNMDVIQEAINSAPEGSFEDKTIIVLRGEQWRRQTFEEYLFDPGDGSQHKRKALLVILNKHVTIVPETRISQFDGAASTNASGMAIIGGSVKLERLEFSGFNMDYNCQINDLVQPCSLGHGLFVDKDARVNIKGVRFAQNEIAGINNVRGQVNVTNSLFVNNGNADIVSQGLLESGASLSTIEVANSVFAKTNMYSTNPIIARQDTRANVTNSILHSPLVALEKAHVSVKYSLFKYNQEVSDQT